jgi:hypothetical protein
VSFSLSDYFMKFGHSTCMFLCGVLFLGLSFSLSRFVLWPEELQILKKNAWVQVFGISMISLGMFAKFGGDLVISFVILWLIGAMAGGVTVTRLASREAIPQ